MGEVYKFHWEGDVLTFRFVKPVLWDEELAEEVVQERLQITKKEEVPCLVEGENVLGMTPGARKFLANEGEEGVAALGVLIRSPVDRIIANFYLAFSRPNMPTRLFTSREKALQWLRHQEFRHM